MLCAVCGSGGGGSATGDAARTVLAAIPEHGDAPHRQAETTYVGRVDEPNALIAVVSNGDGAAAYLCDGKEISEWFLGSADGSGLHLDGEKGGSVDGELADATIAGGVVHAGVDYSFTAVEAVEQESGLYRSTTEDNGARIVSGWIFFDGEWRGADEGGGKAVVQAVSGSGIDEATGTGTGLGTPRRNHRISIAPGAGAITRARAASFHS